MLHSKLLADSTEDVHRSAAKAMQAARGAVHKSEILMERSREVLEKAEKDLKEVRAKNAQRATQKPVSGPRNSQKS